MILQLVAFALKSLLVAGWTLGLLRLFGGRSAAQRSAIAHAGLIALLLLPAGEMLLPRLAIETPASTGGALVAPRTVAPLVQTPVLAAAARAPETNLRAAVEPDAQVEWPLVVYALPVLLLIALTLLALARLFALRTKAMVLIEPTWLSAMAHAQRRMGFKHGTALLTSPELSSPISWGLLRPVILLNDEALHATGEAEAIIAHELAHVERLDWAKLVIARLATAIHWFNPFAWILAKEAHQLREETADDAVLAADIDDADYAQLLVGIARHECKGLLLGAHGVAPGRDSLKRRVQRVLDKTVVRGPGARRFVAGVAVGSIALTAPLAALTLAPGSPAAVQGARQALRVPRSPAPASLPMAVAEAVGQAADRSQEIASLAVDTALRRRHIPDRLQIRRDLALQRDQREKAAIEERSADAQVRAARRMAAAAGAQAMLAGKRAGEAVDRAIALRALAIDPATARSLQAELPGRRLAASDYASLRATRVSPQFIAEMRALGYGDADVEDLAAARSVGVTGDFGRRMQRRFGTSLPFGRLIQLRALAGRDGSDAAGPHPGSRPSTRQTMPVVPDMPDWIRDGRPPPGIHIDTDG